METRGSYRILSLGGGGGGSLVLTWRVCFNLPHWGNLGPPPEIRLFEIDRDMSAVHVLKLPPVGGVMYVLLILVVKILGGGGGGRWEEGGGRWGEGGGDERKGRGGGRWGEEGEGGGRWEEGEGKEITSLPV